MAPDITVVTSREGEGKEKSTNTIKGMSKKMKIKRTLFTITLGHYSRVFAISNLGWVWKQCKNSIETNECH